MKKGILGKFMRPLALAILAITMLSACASPSPVAPANAPSSSVSASTSTPASTKASGGTVNMMVHSSLADTAAFKKYLEEKTGVTINIEKNPLQYADVVTKVTTLMASGDKSYDLFYIDEILFLSFSSAGFLEPLDSAFKPEDLSQFIPGYEDKFMRYNGKLYSIPANLSPMLLYVNKKMFKDAGLSYPKTKEEFIDVATKLTKGDNYGLVESWDGSFMQDAIHRYARLFGGDYYEFQMPETQEAVKFMYDMMNKYKIISKDAISDNAQTVNQKMIDGKGAMITQWGNFASTAIAAGKYPSDFEAIPMPQFKTNKAIYSCWMWVMNAKSSNKESAKKVLKVLANPESQAHYMKSSSKNPPANVKVWSDSKLKEGLLLIDESKMYMDANSLIARRLSKNHSEYMTFITALLQKYFIGQITYEKTIEDAKREVPKIINK